VAGSWFALCQSAGATGVIAGPVGVVAGVAAATVGLGVAAFVVHLRNRQREGNGDNETRPLTVETLREGVPDLVVEDYTRLLDRLNAIHVLTVQDFLIVSHITMRERFDETLSPYLERIGQYQERLRSNVRN
jgi:hypothetical protein